MLGRLRRRLARATWRSRDNVGYWWLEQVEWWRDRHRPWRVMPVLAGRLGTAIGDRWYDLAHGVRRRTRRLRRFTKRVGHGLAAPWVATSRRSQAWARERSRAGKQRLSQRSAQRRDRAASSPRPQGPGVVATRLAALRGRTADRVRGFGAGTRRRLGALGAGTARRTRAVVTAVVGAIAATRARTGRGLRALGTTVGAGAARLSPSTVRAARGLHPARVAVVVAAVLVVGGAIASGVRIADDDGSGEPAGPATGRAEQASSTRGQAGHPGGPGLSRPGIHLRALPDRSGDVEVVERIITPRPIWVLPLAAPPAAPGDDGPPARLVDLRVVVDDTVIPVAGPGEVGEPQQVTLPRATTTVELRYRLVDADERSATAPPGRATLSLRPAASGALASAPTVVQVRGAVVHTLVCVEAPQDRQLCGVDDRTGWHTEPVSAATSNVLALVDLPPA